MTGYSLATPDDALEPRDDLAASAVALAPAAPGPPELGLRELLTAFRARHCLSMQAASALAGVGRTVWRTWEQGVIPAPENLVRLAELLDLSPALMRRAAGPDLVTRAHDCPCGMPHGLAALRIRAGLSSRQLAARVHVSPSTITHWENSDRPCGWQDRGRVAAALGVDRDEVDAALGPLSPNTAYPCPGLLHARSAQGMTRPALAERIGVDPATVRRWERRGVVSLKHVDDLKQIFGEAVLQAPTSPPPAPERLPRPLTRMRTASGISVRVAAGRLGVSMASVYSWERGTRRPDWRDLRRMARMYRRPVAEVFAAAGIPGPRHLHLPPWSEEELPDVLVELRRWAGLTQEALAHTLGVHSSSVAAWERGRHLPSAQALEALTRWLTD